MHSFLKGLSKTNNMRVSLFSIYFVHSLLGEYIKWKDFTSIFRSTKLLRQPFNRT